MTVSAFRPKLSLLLLGALALSACATGGGGGGLGPAEVTRFHLGQPIAPGEILIEPRPGGLPAGPEFNVYATIVAGELARLGFRQAQDVTKAEQLAVVDVTRDTREGMARRASSLSFGLGGATGGYRGGVGLGGGFSFPIGKARSNDVVVTMLTVQLKRRSDGTVIWEGRAQGEARADTPAADPDTAVRRLAGALFQGFPGESGRTITVK